MQEANQSKYIHWVSTTLVGAMSCFETGAMSKEQVTELAMLLKERAISEKQSNFIDAYLKLLDKVEAVLPEKNNVQN